MSIDILFKMKVQPGVVVVGRRNADEESVFDDLMQKLSEFYKSRVDQDDYHGPGLVFVSQTYNPTQAVHECPVNESEPPNMEFRLGTDVNGNQIMTHKEDPIVEYGTIKVQKIDEKQGTKWCGAALGRWDWAQHIFAVYFNLVDGTKSEIDRNDFYRFTNPSER